MRRSNFQSKQKKDTNCYTELFQRSSHNPILTAKDWPYPAHSVFNPGATMFQGKVLLLARVEDRRGFSHLTKALSADGVSHWQIDPSPTLAPDPDQYPEECWGIEDPRIVRLDELDRWAVTYTAYSRGGPLVAMALTRDFTHFERMGPLMPPEDKDAALFPRKIGGKWLIIHRPLTANYVPGAHIWISSSDDFKSWGQRQVLLHARRGGWWDGGKIGLAAPPIETDAGWLLLYHGVRQTASGAIYRLGIALLHREDPTKVLRRGDAWIFGPTASYEREGDVDDVVFPSGWVLDETHTWLKLYYGGADSCIALATAKLSDILAYVKTCPTPMDTTLY